MEAIIYVTKGTQMIDKLNKSFKEKSITIPVTEQRNHTVPSSSVGFQFEVNFGLCMMIKKVRNTLGGNDW